MSRRWLTFAAVCLLAILLSQELARSLPLAGVGPDLVVVVIVVFAGRARSAATSGFSVGLVRDLLVSTPAGIGAITYAAVGYVTASLAMARSAWSLLAVVTVATFLSQLVIGLLGAMLHPDLSAGPVLRVTLATTAYTAVLAPLILPTLRRLVPTEVGERAEAR